MISKKLIFPAAAVVVAASLYGVSQVSAASDPAGQTLADKIASAFHLDKTKVQAVIDQNRTDQQAKHEAKFEDRLTQAVTDKKITAAQKDAILVEQKKLKAELDGVKDKTSTERKAVMDKVRTEATDWAKQNNLDAKWLMAFGPHLRGGHGGPGHTGGQSGGADDSQTPPASPAE